MEKQYAAIDLKSFYASVECTERGFDPLDANLVVADESRTDKTICLAVSPALKSLGISGRARLFEAKSRIAEVNRERLALAPGHRFTGKSIYASELKRDPSLELDFVVATPRMHYYMDYSRSIVEIYLRYVSPEDLLVYSIDEVFIDVTPYLVRYRMNAHDFVMMMIRTVMEETRITATAGIGTNMYLAKIAMDIVAKRMPADKDGVRIAELDERRYREELWGHRPLTDFWRIGRGIARKLETYGMYTMGDIARCSLGKRADFKNEDLLYRMFGVNAELLIDHAWGWEPTEIKDCKSYVPDTKSLSQGQVLSRPYQWEEGRVVVQEMADQLSMDLVRKGLYTDQVTLDVGYDVENLIDPNRARTVKNEIVTDWYGRRVPKPVHGSKNLGRHMASSERMVEAVRTIYDRITDPALLVRRFNVSVGNLLTADEVKAEETKPEQLDLLTDYETRDAERAKETAALEKETRRQKALLNIRDKYGKNAVVKGLNLQEGATAIERNAQIGGHKA
jgi:DNA polymerase V